LIARLSTGTDFAVRRLKSAILGPETGEQQQAAGVQGGKASHVGADL
jgi:hypothetical protein